MLPANDFFLWFIPLQQLEFAQVSLTFVFPFSPRRSCHLCLSNEVIYFKHGSIASLKLLLFFLLFFGNCLKDCQNLIVLQWWGRKLWALQGFWVKCSYIAYVLGFFLPLVHVIKIYFVLLIHSEICRITCRELLNW